MWATQGHTVRKVKNQKWLPVSPGTTSAKTSDSSHRQYRSGPKFLPNSLPPGMIPTIFQFLIAYRCLLLFPQNSWNSYKTWILTSRVVFSLCFFVATHTVTGRPCISHYSSKAFTRNWNKWQEGKIHQSDQQTQVTNLNWELTIMWKY